MFKSTFGIVADYSKINARFAIKECKWNMDRQYFMSTLSIFSDSSHTKKWGFRVHWMNINFLERSIKAGTTTYLWWTKYICLHSIMNTRSEWFGDCALCMTAKKCFFLLCLALLVIARSTFEDIRPVERSQPLLELVNHLQVSRSNFLHYQKYKYKDLDMSSLHSEILRLSCSLPLWIYQAPKMQIWCNMYHISCIEKIRECQATLLG